jgi:penicillin amidase
MKTLLLAAVLTFTAVLAPVPTAAADQQDGATVQTATPSDPTYESAPETAMNPVSISGLQTPARVRTDADGIPHIDANNEHDLLLMQGWVHARDRLFQMDLMRRQASGTLAELLGPSRLPSDIQFRTIGLRRAAELSLPLLSQETRTGLEAYAAGVNAWVVDHPLPPEYGPLELTTFEPWSPVDSLVIAKMHAFGLSFDLDTGLTEVLLIYLAAGATLGFDGAALFFEDVFRSAPFDPASTVPDATGGAPFAAPGTPAADAGPASDATAAGVAGLSPVVLELARAYAERVRDLPIFGDALEPGNRTKGSNEWAVAGSHTQSGDPVIANDPHLTLNTPATFYQVHLRAVRDGFDVIGSGYAGIPYVIIGQNQRITWGATTNPMDVTDTYQEQLVPDATSPSGLSTVFEGALEHVIPLPQVFRFNNVGNGIPNDLVVVPPGGGVPAAVLIVPRRNNGPLVAVDLSAGFALSVQYTGFSGTREFEAIRRWNRAANLDDFIEGLQFFDFGSQNWVYGDVDGNIGYFTSAEMPLREDLQAGFVSGLPPFFIRDGTGGNEWLPVSTPQPGQAVPFEILPFDEMPQLVNPPAGYFVNANNDPAGTTLDNNALNQLRPGGGIYYLNPGYAIGTRAGRIEQALEELLSSGPVTADDMQAIQADVVMLDAQVFTPSILQAFSNATEPGADPMLAALAADPRIAEAIGRLSAWDFSTPTGIPEGYDGHEVDGMLTLPDANEIADSVAASIYSVWRGQMIRNTIDATLGTLPVPVPVPGSLRSMTALRNLLDNFDTNLGVGASGLDFFSVPGVADPFTRRDIVLLQSLADALDLLAGPGFAPAFGFSTDQEDYRWGRLHRIVLDHPLGSPFDIPPAGGVFPPPLPDLPGIPVDGGFGVVDASSHSSRADDAYDFMFGSGPVRRYVGEPVNGPRRIEGRSSLPGGQSGVLGSPFYENLLERWLTNDTYPLRQRPQHINADLFRLEHFLPGS